MGNKGELVESMGELRRKMSSGDEDAAVRSLSFSIGKDLDLDVALDIVEEFVKQRPHWVLVLDPRGAAGVLMLHKYSPRSETYMRWVGSRQYPPAEQCGELPYAIPYFSGGTGWGSLFAQLSSMLTSHQHAIFCPWISRTNSEKDVTYLGPVEWCPHDVNKWLCQFMRPTNCTIPEGVVSGLHLPEVGQVGLYQGQHAWTERTSSGHEVGTAARHVYQKEMLSRWDYNAVEVRLGYHGPIEENIVYDRNNDSRVIGANREILDLYGVLWRFNKDARKRMMALADAVRDPNEQSSCTAMHIRRGDRVLAGVDSAGHEEFCRTHIAVPLPQGGHKCVDTLSNNATVSCVMLLDLGCFRGSRLGIFGGLTLEDYLDRASHVSPAKRVFVMSDDHKWLQNEISKLDPSVGWNIYYIARSKDRGRDDSGLYYSTSVELVRECDAFIGHFGSAVSMQLRDIMCVHHGARGGLPPKFGCPPVVDIGRALYGKDHVSSPWGDRRRLRGRVERT